MRKAELYRITYIPSGKTYYGSTWKEGKNYIDRFNEHMAKKGSKYIAELLNNGATKNDFVTELLMIGPVDYVCDIEMKLAKNNLYPYGLNGNAGKNIIRTPEGQQRVSAAVSAAKLGKTKEMSTGVASQAQKLSHQCGENRTDKQKLWDSKKAAVNKLSGNRPPKMINGSKKMTNGTVNTFVAPEMINDYISRGWRMGSCRHAWNKGKKMKTRETVTCPHCGKVGNISQMKRYHNDNCKSR